MLNQVKSQLKSEFNHQLVDILFESFTKAKEHYYLGSYRPACMEGARFAEAALRMLQEKMDGTFLPPGQPIPNFKNIALGFESKSAITFNESLRIVIPHVLIVVYDIRNKRNIGHIHGSIDENYIDATLSIDSCSWVLAELFRVYSIAPDIQHGKKIVDSIIKLKIPLIQEFNGFLKVLNPKLNWKEKVLALLYYRGDEGCTEQELLNWLKGIRESNLSMILNRLELKDSYSHNDNGKHTITNTGRLFVEQHIPLSI